MNTTEAIKKTEWLTMNCRNTRIKVISLITVANHKFTNYTDNQVNQSKLEANTCGWQGAGENSESEKLV